MNSLIQPAKKKVLPHKNENIVEQLSSVAGSVATSTKDMVGAVSSDVLNSIFGGPVQGGELRPNEAITVGREATPEVVVEVKPVVRTPEWMVESKIRADQIQVHQKLEAVRVELKALAASIKNLKAEIVSAVEQAPVAAGVYHFNFFEQLRSMLKILREQVEDSRSWLAMSKSRKAKKGYWGMVKKHGTSFGMSNERSIATAAG